MNRKTLINDLTVGNVGRQLVRFSLPFMLANLLQMVYTLVDMMIIGQVVGSAGLSAVSNGGDLLHIFAFAGMGFASGGQVIISQYVGAKDQGKLNATIGTMFSIIQALSIVVTVLALAMTDLCLRWLNIPPEAMGQARDYCVVGFIGMFFIYGYNMVSAILRGMGDSVRPLVFIAVATVLNLVLDVVFVVWLDMGARGAALATVIGQAVSFVASLVYLYIRRDSFGFDFSPRNFIPDWPITKMLFRLGIPFTVHSVAVNFSMLYVNSWINAYGVAVSALTGVGNKIGNAAIVVTGALGTAGSAMIGQNVGAGEMDRTSQIVRCSYGIGLVFVALFSALMIAFPTEVFGLWSSDPEVLALVPDYLPVVILNIFGHACRNPLMSLVNGLGFATMSLVVGLLDGVVIRIGLALLMGVVFDMGIYGFWYGAVLAGFTACFTIGPYYLSGRWKTRKPITHQNRGDTDR